MELEVQCLSVIEGNAYWPPTTSGERTGLFFFFLLLLFLSKKKKKKKKIEGGYCEEGYGGSPLRNCIDNGGSNGDFDEIISPCIQC